MSMARRFFLPVLALCLFLSQGFSYAAPVDVYVQSDRGYWLPAYEVSQRGAEGRSTFRSYLEAVYGDRYSIYVRNNTSARVGVVVAVDGRNIVTGQKSNLSPDERMYVLDPYGTGSYDGWRTEANKVNRFYFTDPGGSYSAAFGDYSAMGVIAVVAYREVPPPPPPPPPQPLWEREGRGDVPGYGYDRKEAPSAPQSSAAPDRMAKSQGNSAAEAKKDSLGTGYGEERYSPTVRVEFRTERRPIARYFLKYETRDSLCRKGIADCRPPGNRLWDEEGYAPPPPQYR